MQFSRFTKYALLVLSYNLLVIVWGAYVRASKSGAGCGSHWPLCNGQIIPQAPSVATLIEFSHRLTSGLVLILVLGLVYQAFRRFAAGHSVRKAAVATLVFTITEALIGAGLVLFEYVAENRSIGRALWMSAHLINTFLLVAALTLTVWESLAPARPRWRGQGTLRWLMVVALGGTLVLGVSGAISALGATLFPVTSLAEGLRQDLSPTSHILIRLRFYHPWLAGVMGSFLIGFALWLRGQRSSEGVKRLAGWLIALVLIQLTAGLVNLLLHAPTWLQLVHLLLSDLLWIVLVLLAHVGLATPPRLVEQTPLNAPVPV